MYAGYADAIDDVNVDDADTDADADTADNHLWSLCRVVQGGVPETTELLKWVWRKKHK